MKFGPDVGGFKALTVVTRCGWDNRAPKNYISGRYRLAPRRFHNTRRKISAPDEKGSQGAVEGNQAAAAGDLTEAKKTGFRQQYCRQVFSNAHFQSSLANPLPSPKMLALGVED